MCTLSFPVKADSKYIDDATQYYNNQLHFKSNFESIYLLPVLA